MTAGNTVNHGTAVSRPRRPEQILQRDARPRQPLTWEERQALLPGLESDIRLLKKITTADFSEWLQPRELSGGQVGTRPPGQQQARNHRPPGTGPSQQVHDRSRHRLAALGLASGTAGTYPVA